MYGYRAKHKILSGYLDRLLKDKKEDDPLDIKHFVLMRQFAKELGGKKDGKIAQYITHMTLEGYLTLKDIPAKRDMEVSITTRGMSAALSEFYKIKQHDFFWKAAMNILMTVANIAVAVTAIWALTKGNGELQKLEERLRKIEGGLLPNKAATSPNNRQTQNFDQPITKDSLPKTVSLKDSIN